MYASEQVPAPAPLGSGAVLGKGVVDEPIAGDSDRCERQRTDVRVLGLEGVDPRVAVAVEGRRRSIFVLGARCRAGEELQPLDCLREPVLFRGGAYTGVRYPESPSPAAVVPLGAALGEGDLGGGRVETWAIEGVDPSVAIGVEGRPNEAFIAPGVCPYERFDNRPARDDLLRCLRGPLWLVFDPVGVESGAEVVARSDRPARPELEGAPVGLVRLEVVGDVVPSDRSGEVTVGALAIGEDRRITLPIVLPELEPGLYEAVVTCDGCAPAFGGQTAFPAGSLFVFEQQGSGGRLVFVLIGAAFIAAAVASVVFWRRGRTRRRSQPGSADGH